VIWLLDRRAVATYLPAIHKSSSVEEGSRHATAKALERVRRRFTVRARFVALVALMSTTLTALAQVDVVAVGNTIYATVGVATTGHQCCNGATLDSPLPGGASCSQPCGGPTTFSFTCNWVGTHTVLGCWSDDTHPAYQCMTKTIDVTDPPTCTKWDGVQVKFDIPDVTQPSSASLNSTRILLSNKDLSYKYPDYEGLLGKDRAIPIDFRVLKDGIAVSNVDVTIRVTDPADPSQYMVGGSGLQPAPGSAPGDNVGPLATLSGTDILSSGGGTYTTKSGANGYVETELDLDPQTRGGDNFQLIATATLADGTTGTAKSGVVTAWKRLFLEKKQMFKRGAPLATDAPAGVTHVVVVNQAISSTGDKFVKGDTLLLMHAPSFGQPKGPGSYYQNFYTISAKPVAFTASGQTAGVGTVTTSASKDIVGTNTFFTKLHVEDVINVSTGVPGVFDTRVVMAIADKTHLTLNAPTTTAATNLTYTIGDPALVLTGKGAYLRLALDRQLTENYQREPLVKVQTGQVILNDAVVKLSSGGVTSTDYYDASDALVVGTAESQWAHPFPSAYTEYVVLQPQPDKQPNLVAPLPRTLLADDEFAQELVDKWFVTPTPVPQPTTDPNPFLSYRYVVPDNHQLLLIGDAETGTTGSSGLGIRLDARPFESTAVALRAAAEAQVGISGALCKQVVDTILQKTEVHELTHLWNVNNGVFPGSQDHCFQQVAFNSSASFHTPDMLPGTLYCTMSGIDLFGSTDPTTTSVCGTNGVDAIQFQYGNGIATFHIQQINGVWSSEYLGIRNFPDPWTPQN